MDDLTVADLAALADELRAGGLTLRRETCQRLIDEGRSLRTRLSAAEKRVREVDEVVGVVDHVCRQRDAERTAREAAEAETQIWRAKYLAISVEHGEEIARCNAAEARAVEAIGRTCMVLDTLRSLADAADAGRRDDDLGLEFGNDDAAHLEGMVAAARVICNRLSAPSPAGKGNPPGIPDSSPLPRDEVRDLRGCLVAMTGHSPTSGDYERANRLTGCIYRGALAGCHASDCPVHRPAAPPSKGTPGPATSKFGWCPECHAEVKMRGRGGNENDYCDSGCIYPQKNTLLVDPWTPGPDTADSEGSGS